VCSIAPTACTVQCHSLIIDRSRWLACCGTTRMPTTRFGRASPQAGVRSAGTAKARCLLCSDRGCHADIVLLPELASSATAAATTTTQPALCRPILSKCVHTRVCCARANCCG